jgi:cell volume regulation protein A
MFIVDTLILVTGMLLLLGLVSSKLSNRLGVPVLVLFLLVGILAGSEGVGGLEFEDYRLAHAIGTIALAIILFDGGLGTSLAAVRLSWKPSLLLATLGVLLTALITGVAASWILNISLLEGLLLGSIVSSTDASAVFSILRWGGSGLPKRISAVLEVESASNDPMAIFLTIGCIELLLGNVTLGPGLLGLFASQMFVGGVVVLAGGYTAAWAVNRIELGAAGMYPVLVSAFGLLTYGAAVHIGGSGFLAVYLAGVVVGNRQLMFQQSIRRFHDAIAWLAQIIMFVTLATFPLMLATPEISLQAPLLFDVVFFIVVVSAVIQGTSLTPVARWLGLECQREPEPPVTLELSSLRHMDGKVIDYAVSHRCRIERREPHSSGC